MYICIRTEVSFLQGYYTYKKITDVYLRTEVSELKCIRTEVSFLQGYYTYKKITDVYLYQN